MNHLKRKRTRTFYQYAALYFVVLFLLSGVIMFSVLRFSADKLVSLDIQNTQNSLQQAAELLEKQYQTLESVAVQVSSRTNYRLSANAGSALSDIELLKDFRQYTNYSPLAKQYFLVYSVLDKIYTSAGSTSFFNYYAPANLGISGAAADALRSRILQARSFCFERFATGALLIFPLDIYAGADSRSAALCFVLTDVQLQGYLAQMTVGLPERYSIIMDGELLFSVGEGQGAAPDALQSQHGYLEAVSSRGRFRFGAVPALKGWRLLFSQDRWLFLCAAVLLAAAVLLSLALAQATLWPLEKLLRKYTPDSERIENDFRQLDDILCSMDQAHTSTKTLLKKQLLNLLLRGSYSEELLRRWSMLGIRFDFPFCCVFLVDPGAAPCDLKALCARLESAGSGHCRLYATEITDEQRIAVIANYGPAMPIEELQRRLASVAAEMGAKLYAGSPVDSPKRLSLSFMAALTESRYGAPPPKQNVISADQLAEQLIAAAESGIENAMDSACAAAVDYLSAEELNGLLTKHHIYELVSSVCRIAQEKGLPIEKSEVNALVLLPDCSMIVSDLKKLLLSKVNAEKAHRLPGDETARLIVEYVIANAYDPDISLQDMSQEFGLSADYISSMIKRETGAAFKEYLTMLRIGEARRLLIENPALTVNDVAVRVGYRKPSNFSKKFKELTGMLPSQIRQQHV